MTSVCVNRRRAVTRDSSTTRFAPSTPDVRPANERTPQRGERGASGGRQALASGVDRPLLERKPGGFDHARPLEHWDLPECYALLRRRLEADDPRHGTRSFIRVLRLLEKFSLPQLGSALTWAVRWGMLPKRPDMGGGSKKSKGKMSKGRPITGEEFDRMLAKVPDIVLKDERNPRISRDYADSERIVESWRHYLRGLWLSGLRLGESLELFWDRDDRPRIDLSGRRPMLRIPGALQKSGKDEILPITPGFAEFLEQTPERRRRERVFNPLRRLHGGGRLTDDRVIRIVSEIGEAAGISVWTHPVTGTVKHASAHDLRRSFGFRWARRVMPAVLQKLMRHESINTTMDDYATSSAGAIADQVWSSWQSDTSGDTRQKRQKVREIKNYQCMTKPPSTLMVWPVICWARLEERKMTVSAMSAGDCQRPRGTIRRILSVAQSW